MNGKTFLLYATESAGLWKAAPVYANEFETLKERGWINLGSEQVRPVFAALVRVEDNYDFVLKRSRDEEHAA